MKAKAGILAVALLVGCAGCATDDNPYDIPPMVASSVNLAAHESDPLGNVVDTLTFRYVPNVKVWLLEGDARVDSVLTTFDGVYLFRLKVGHTYRTLAGIPPALTDTLPAFTVVRDGYAIYPTDTLSLKPFGSLTTGPNPSSGDIQFRFNVTTDGVCNLSIWDLTATRVLVLANQRFIAGVHTIVWNGRDNAGQLVPAGKYWAILTTPDESSADLLIRQP